MIKIFGDTNIFAIQYKTDQSDTLSNRLAYCHLILGNMLIGDKNETCLIGTWGLMLENLKKHFEENRVKLEQPIFKNLSLKEIFELIRKANLTEDECDPMYEYLPQMESDFWYRHKVRLDETIDAYSIIVIRSRENLKFIWEGWRKPCPPQQIGKIYSVEVPFDLFITTVNTYLNYIKKAYPNFNWSG
ncbi:MAG: Imm42 family immunity protein [Flavisolibacter sp.]|jgi:hypothetical protein